MRQQTFSYKDYLGSLEASVEDNYQYGRILDIDDLVIYEAQTVEALETAFRNAVDDYLRTCAQMGEAPETPRQRRDAALGG